jgi:hypothetical protein
MKASSYFLTLTLSGILWMTPATAQEDILLHDFQRNAILSVILTQCTQNTEVMDKKDIWYPFTIHYGNYLADKTHLDAQFITKTFANAALSVAQQYGDTIPDSICQQALSKTLDIQQAWQPEHSSQKDFNTHTVIAMSKSN